jgi:succinoglycan biosynthesis transport protein ExoP
LQQLDEQALSLEDKIRQKRLALDAFRERHDIVTLERDSNQALNRLKTLQESLAKAEEESIQARAQLQALQAALANGETVMPKEQAAALGNLKQQAAELRVRVAQQKKRYTDMFIQNDPNKRALPEQLARLEARIEEMTRQGLRDVVNQARQQVESTTLVC